MALEINSFSELDAEKVSAVVATMSQLMQERHPEVELTRGVFHDLVLYFNGLLNSAVRENLDRILASNSLLKITQNPALADDSLVDNVLSNYNLVRDPGSPATGLATFIMSTPLTTNITNVSRFTVDGLQYDLAGSYTIVPSAADIVTANDRAMRPIGDGTYAVTLPMIAVEIGVTGNIKRGVTFKTNYSPDNVLRIYAASDFVGGREASTNSDYVKKLSAGVTAKSIGGRKSYEAFIRAQKEFANILHVSVLGCGDPEQQRDQHSLFPVSGGGKVDVYVQTTNSAQESDHLVAATYIGNSVAGTLWQIIVPRDLAPGFYEVSRVLPPTASGTNTAGSYRIVEDIRDVNLLNTNYVPDIQYPHEGAYSRYQTTVIRFEDTDKFSSGLIANQTTAIYTLTTKALPFISEIHNLLTARENRARGTDILVKAAVPCFTAVSLVIAADSNDYIDDATIFEMKKDIVTAISNVGFSGQLHASVITGAAHKFLTGRQAVQSTDMFGKIRRPDGTALYLRDSTVLVIPFDPGRFVTGRTTAFLTGLDDIEITVTNAGFAN